LHLRAGVEKQRLIWGFRNHRTVDGAC
jgi:hypothetical protein